VSYGYYNYEVRGGFKAHASSANMTKQCYVVGQFLLFYVDEQEH